MSSFESFLVFTVLSAVNSRMNYDWGGIEQRLWALSDGRKVVNKGRKECEVPKQGTDGFQCPLTEEISIKGRTIVALYVLPAKQCLILRDKTVPVY